MVTVSISETYDLHTQVNKMSIIGIHTPKKDLIQKTYPGLCMNYKYCRIKSVDVALSTAQQLPLGVDQIGLDANQIRPQDMMNPILYKAVSNDSWSTLEYRIKGLIDQGRRTGSSYTAPPISGDMVDVENDGATGIADEHGVYYALLSNRDGFRVAHPQSGLRMKGLRPIVFQKLFSDAVNTIGGTTNYVSGDTQFGIEQNSDNTMSMVSLTNGSSVMRGRAVPMPRFNTTYLTGISPGVSYPGGGSASPNSNWQYNGMGNGNPANFQIQMPDLPPVMLGAIVLPPVTATTGILYYRMVTRCWIEFTDVRPITDVTSFADMNSDYYPSVYHSDYAEQSKSMDKTTDMVDVKNAEIEKIMEGR